MKLLDFYKSILSAGCLIANAEGQISVTVGKSTCPFTVGGKRLVLPTPAHLAMTNKEEIVLFNPLAENVFRGESDVMSRFRSAVNGRLNLTIRSALEELLVLATSTAKHAQLKPDQFELMAIFKDSDEKSIADFGKVFAAMPLGNIDKCFVHIFMKKNANIRGKTHRRGAIVTFPLYDDLVANEKQAWGVALRKKDYASLKGVLEYIFPGLEKKDEYSRGSLSDTAPTLDALMLAVVGLASHLNSLVEDCSDTIDDIKSLLYSDDWVSEIDNLGQFAMELRLLPMQSGNEGSVERAGVVKPGTPALVTPQPVAMPVPGHYQPPPQHYPTQQAVPQSHGPVVGANGLIDFAASMRNNPQFAPAAHGTPYYQPPPGPIGSRMGAPVWGESVHTHQRSTDNSSGYGLQIGYGQPSRIFI